MRKPHGWGQSIKEITFLKSNSQTHTLTVIKWHQGKDKIYWWSPEDCNQYTLVVSSELLSLRQPVQTHMCRLFHSMFLFSHLCWIWSSDNFNLNPPGASEPRVSLTKTEIHTMSHWSSAPILEPLIIQNHPPPLWRPASCFLTFAATEAHQTVTLHYVCDGGDTLYYCPAEDRLTAQTERHLERCVRRGDIS